MKMRWLPIRKLPFTSFGSAGLIVATSNDGCASVLGVVAWWSSRPAKPKPWNSEAITATYTEIDTETTGDKNQFEFFYTLQNNTDNDYRVETNGNMHLAALLRASDALAFSNGKAARADYPIFVPAHSRVRIGIHLAYSYPDRDNVENSPDVRHDFETRMARYVTDKLSNLEGFVLMDDVNRYKIEMKDGWSERAKEPLRVKTSDSEK